MFQKAARHVQLEPVWGGSEDTAAPLRAAAIIALARIEGSSSLPLLVDAMTDPAKDVRIAAAMALGAVGTEAAGLLLRLKARIGDSDPDVLSECLSGLLAVDPRENLPFVSGFLEPGDAARCEAAALALGKSRLPEALDPLKACWPRSHFSEVETAGPAGHRHAPPARRHRLPAGARRVRVGDRQAIAALSALKIHNYDPRLRERLAQLVQKAGSRTLQARFDRDFPSDER